MNCITFGVVKNGSQEVTRFVPPLGLKRTAVLPEVPASAPPAGGKKPVTGKPA
ncbi:MAG: hypothetical protein V4772_01360 [Pseudomonadota bacterium]